MKKLLLVIAIVGLAACGQKLEGTYSDAMNVLTYTFKPDGKLYQSALGLEVELNYEREGDKIKLITPQGNLILTLLSDGAIEGPMGIRLNKRK